MSSMEILKKIRIDYYHYRIRHSMPVKIERYMSLWGWYDAIDWEVFGAKITSMMEISDVNETACDLLPDQSSHIL